jgi:hypothetical protein
MTNEHRARLSAGLAIGLGAISLGMVVSSGANWAAIVAGSAILVGFSTLYRLRTQTTTKDHEPL